MIKISAFIAFFIIAVIGAKPAAAQVADAQVANAQVVDACDFSAQVKELMAIRRNASLTDLQRYDAELEVRRGILTAAIACDQDELTERATVLSHMPNDIKSLPAHRKMRDSLAEASKYYDQRKASIPALTLQGTKEVSRAMALWRTEKYLPLIAWADNFILWTGNQQFLERASRRLGQVNRLAFSLKIVNQDEVDGQFKKAEDSLKIALTENDQARDFLNQAQAADALVHIKASLQALAATYQIFFELQESLQSIVQ